MAASRRGQKRKRSGNSRGIASSQFSSRDEGADYKHCGFLLTAVESDPLLHDQSSIPPDCCSNSGEDFGELVQCRDGVQEAPDECRFSSLVGAECELTGQGANATIAIDAFHAIPAAIAEESVLIDPATPDSTSRSSEKCRSSSGKRRGSSSVTIPSIVSQLQRVASMNGLKFRGRVVKVVQKGAVVRAVVLIDVFFPLRHFITLSSWKGGSASAFAMGHLSCDWSRRKELEASSSSIDDRDVWNLSECHVVGCSLHSSVSTSVKNTRFSLHEIFNSLSAGDAGRRFVGTSLVCAGDEDRRCSGLWDLPDEILTSVFSRLLPRDLLSIAAVCRHTRELTRFIVPCMNLRLFPHQNAAVQWMLHRETNPQRFRNPIHKDLQTEDGFHLFLNSVTGEISIEMPELSDFRGGLFCDEPGLGKTITALSLVLKSQGIFPSPPPGAEVCWSSSLSGEKIGYYEATSGTQRMSLLKRCMAMKGRRYQLGAETPSEFGKRKAAADDSILEPLRIRRKLLDSYGDGSEEAGVADIGAAAAASQQPEVADDVWVQCDGCKKWRKLAHGCGSPQDGSAWFCKMNRNPQYQSCSAPEESWDGKDSISHLEGFHRKGSEAGLERNVSFFFSILKDRAALLNSEAKKALNWLADLRSLELTKMASSGIPVPQHLRMVSVTGRTEHEYEEFFLAFGLVPKQDKKKVPKWQYPEGLTGFHLDTLALKCALSKPVEEVTRVYLSKATLIVVPSNLVEHWKTQIQRHTSDKQLRVYACLDSKNAPTSHSLAWDYDIVITTFNRLSIEWNSRESSLLMQIHWFRIILDEGHTLGASFSLTNKLQMAVNMRASCRWVLTGTPTPDTPYSQLVNLHPMLRFLHDELYGSQIKLWDAAVLRPFEAHLEEGRLRLVDFLRRCMISARKADLSSIPPCVRKVKLVEFTDNHAASYNELVETVRRNLLMADWNDPDHVESLLNPKQWKLKNTTLRNVRLSCCVAGHIKVRNANQDIQETMEMLVQDGMDPTSDQYGFIKGSLLLGGNCFRCGEWCRLPILTPCLHFLCLSCVSLDCERCILPECGKPYQMQTPKARPENPNPKWPVPQDLIELQPSYIQEDWHSEWQATSSSKVSYLVERLRGLQQENGKLPEKAIVFSQFLEHISAIEMQLTKGGIEHAGMYSPMPAASKMKSLRTFQENPKCVVLLMDSSSALGLDLSFVTHVFLMEPIWDRSIEEQVVSRAHRMGATRPVLVETLAMAGTIEEQMLGFLQRCSDPSRGHHDPAELQYLTRLAFVRKHGSH
ncbi:F-box protein At3g54460 [Selaginella moellendorffii]|nr:F-box protein At3g54460 [Selaginella moellendorffii]|eukprot:XP_002965572.2 F-box protein At3g54460 [Selaginella moellendorffii]